MALYTYRETVYTSLGDGSALTAAAAATMLPNTSSRFTFPAGFFHYVGQSMRIVASGRISSVITTPGTARYDIRLGGTVVFDGLAVLLDTVAAHTNVGWMLEIEMTVRAVGTAGNFMGQGKWTCEDILGVPASAPKGVLSAILPWNSAPAVGSNVNFESALALDSFFTQTVATGSMTCHQFKVISEN
jgi:hypothetical protein